MQTPVPAQHLGLMHFRHVQKGNSTGTGSPSKFLLCIVVVAFRFSLMIVHGVLILNEPWHNEVSQRSGDCFYFFLMICSEVLEQIFMGKIPTVALVPSLNQSLQNTNCRQS